MSGWYAPRGHRLSRAPPDRPGTRGRRHAALGGHRRKKGRCIRNNRADTSYSTHMNAKMLCSFSNGGLRQIPALGPRKPPPDHGMAQQHPIGRHSTLLLSHSIYRYTYPFYPVASLSSTLLAAAVPYYCHTAFTGKRIPSTPRHGSAAPYWSPQHPTVTQYLPVNVSPLPRSMAQQCSTGHVRLQHNMPKYTKYGNSTRNATG